MRTPSTRTVRAAFTLLLAGVGVARAEPVTLTFEQSVYADGAEKGVALKSPEGVGCTEAGTVVVADTGNQRLVTYSLKDGRLSGGAEAKSAQLTYPIRVQIDSKGNVFALDGKTHRIVRLDAKGAPGGPLELKGARSGVPLIPGSFKIDASDSLYVLDIAGRRVLTADPTGNVTREIQLPATGEFTDIAVDATGTVYATEAIEAAVWSAEKGAAAFKALTKSMKDRMNFPAHLAAKRGKLFLVDQYGNGIVVLGIDGSFQGRQLSIGWSDGLVYYPSQICITDGGELFLADRYNNRVQIFTTGS